MSRSLDAVDRAHARAAMRLHDMRNAFRATLDRALERAEMFTTTAFERARQRIDLADKTGANAVNRAQGVVGGLIEKARLAREQREHVVS